MHAIGCLLYQVGVSPRMYITLVSAGCYFGCLLTTWIWLRQTLGARPAQILRQFVLQGLRAGAVGLLGGLALAAYAQRWLASFLYGVRPFDLASFGVVSVGLLALLTFAVWWPARRASRIDPQRALRYE